MTDTTLATIIVAIIAAIPGIIAVANQRRKDVAEITDINQRAARDMIASLTARIKDLEAERDKLETENEELHKQLRSRDADQV